MVNAARAEGPAGGMVRTGAPPMTAQTGRLAPAAHAERVEATRHGRSTGAVGPPMPPVLVSVVSAKGGTGKSSIATALAVAASRHGPTVLYDLDPQLTVARWWIVHRKMKEGSDATSDLTMRRVEAGRLQAAAMQDAGPDTPSPRRWLICDTPGGAYRTIGEAARLSDLVLIPLQPTVPDMAAVPRLVAALADVDPRPPLLAVITRVDRRSRRRIERARRTMEAAGLPVATQDIAQAAGWPEAYERGLAPQELPGWRARRAAGEVERLWGQVRMLAEREARFRQPAAAGGEPGR